jgi:hypothetical protein
MVWVLSPYRYNECPACEGSGYNTETKKLSDDWYSHLRTDGKEGWQHHLEQEDVQALLDKNRLWDFTRVPRNNEQRAIVMQRIADGHNPWLPENNGYIPTAEEVNRWSRWGMGHDSSNKRTCVEARAKRTGIWGHCDVCDGAGELWHSPEIKKAAEEWEHIEPPAGEGYQLWEETSEGSPISPVFDSFDALCDWAADNATTFGHFKATAAEWRKMLDDDFVYHEEGQMLFM